MTDPEEFDRALRKLMSERRAIWVVLVDMLTERFKDDVGDRLYSQMHTRIMARLDRMEEGAREKGLEDTLEDWKRSTDHLFSDVKKELRYLRAPR
jgi:hypothetical protein